MATEKRLIDANAADVERISCYYGDHCYIEDVQEWLNEQPTVDAVEVVHGQWIRGHDLCLCSFCGFEIDTCDDFNYCPNCGANMMDGDTK